MVALTETSTEALEGVLEDVEILVDNRFQTERLFFKKSPFYLGKYLLGYDRFNETHLEWSQFIENNIDPNNPETFRALFLFPREVFKSTFFTITLPIWFLINNPNLTILIGNEVIGNAIAFLSEIKGHLESELFIKYFGDWKTENDWRATDIKIRPRTINRKEPSIDTAGIGSTKTSRHYDILNLDDVAGPEDRDSEAKRIRTFNFFNDMWDVLKRDTGIFFMVGTRWHKEDIYSHVINKLAPAFERDNIGKFHVMIKPAKNRDGSLNYPELLTENKLRELRTVKMGRDGIDIASFHAQYMLDPLDPSTQIFKKFHFVDIEGLKFKKFIGFTDPALKAEKTSDYSAIVVIAEISEGEHKNKWMVVYASIVKRQPAELIKDHNRIYLMWDGKDTSNKAYMEENGFQILLKSQAIKEALAQGKHIPTIGIKNMDNKEARIRGMEPAITMGLILFRKDWETAPEGYRLLVDQLGNFPQGKRDGPDALQGAYKRSQKYYGSVREI